MPNGPEVSDKLTLPERIQLASEQAKSLGETIEKIELVGQSTIENIIDAGTKVSNSISALTGDVNDLSEKNTKLSAAVDALSKDVGKLEDIVKSNKDLSTKVEELTKKDGTIYKLEQEMRDIKGLIDGHNPDTGLFKEINDHFTDLMGS